MVAAAVIEIKKRQYLELENLAVGAMSPLTGFMTEEQFHGVVDDMRLPSGELFPLPVVLDLNSEQAGHAERAGRLDLTFDGDEVGKVQIESVFSCDKLTVAQKIFGTSDEAHPGVKHWLNMGDHFAGGTVDLHRRSNMEFSSYDMTPAETQAYFDAQGWETVAGFQTRNVPHKAHEYLLRLALEQSDGLYIQPLVGLKKRGDYSPTAILTSYETLIGNFLPKDRILLGVLSTGMRYAGPREALLHSIIRRNYGCTHFIVGRDHAGVGDFYGKYEAQDITRRFGADLGIQILRFAGPFYCGICEGIVTERTCPHEADLPEATTQISGTQVRAMLSSGGPIDPHFIRPEIVKSVSGLQVFINEDDL